MNNFYDWKPEHTNAFVTIISVSLGFVAYWFIALNHALKLIFFKRYRGDNAWIAYVTFQKMIGALFMGIIPGMILLNTSDYTLLDLGLKAGNYNESLVYIGVMCLLILIINFFAAKNPLNQAMYPQMRIATWEKKDILINSLAWAVYLFGYEFMYRGLLLMVCYDSFGFWPAVAINLCFYSATHIPKGLGETIGTFPYGLLLCFVTVSTGSIAVAFVTHLALALSNDYFSVYHHPKMKFA